MLIEYVDKYPAAILSDIRQNRCEAFPGLSISKSALLRYLVHECKLALKNDGMPNSRPGTVRAFSVPFLNTKCSRMLRTKDGELCGTNALGAVSGTNRNFNSTSTTRNCWSSGRSSNFSNYRVRQSNYIATI
jgi:hypothetical protein